MSNLPNLRECTICIIGLGYVGLPLAVEFGSNKKNSINDKKINRKVIGFDINDERVKQINLGKDVTNEVSIEELSKADYFEATSDENMLVDADVFIVTVPTPVDIYKKPDLHFLKEATYLVGKTLKKRKKNLKNCNPVVIYESTVYPGATTEICVPILEKESGLKLNNSFRNLGFYVGYSPERINPGDKDHRLTQITKITSGSNDDSADWINQLYGSIIDAGTFKASSIKVAESAKIIENTQRDINIALINELAMIFHKLEVDSLEVLEAAGTKWNFLPFRPGLVGGHCIGVDPYYLTFKSEQLGYTPELLIAGRKINNKMPEWIVKLLLTEMNNKKVPKKGAKILILGLTFKENCPDTRNSKVFDIINFLADLDMNIFLHDPYVSSLKELPYIEHKLCNEIPFEEDFDAVIACVKHNEYLELDLHDWKLLISNGGIVIDIKSIIPKELDPIRM
ncbi:nucleotide sugar dehydrogenase [uncultured Prochlorococcus sp.]|uniref:nucleotide sugar dehydrogenase n=1 Tax=uncultured Prochlorococcus sp. TaxID=159733 RepID=UPI00258CEF6A|nr:nucleotide sugar dehydrogenase [uncultured Prochlorococcus sp.]